MPPLAVVGFGTAVGNWDIARGAAFLFMTNLLAIALSVTIVALVRLRRRRRAQAVGLAGAADRRHPSSCCRYRWAWR